MNQFAKLFQFESGQLLVYKAYDQDNDLQLLIFRTEADEVTIEKKLSFSAGARIALLMGRIDEMKATQIFYDMQDLADGKLNENTFKINI